MSAPFGDRSAARKSNLENCDGKRGYTTFAAAEEVATRMNRQERDTFLTCAIIPYRCRKCGLFHVGNSPTENLKKPKIETPRDEPELRRIRTLDDALDLELDYA